MSVLQAPLVSVIIPVYNMEEFIEDTLNSVLESRYKNIEVIIVDDGSIDNSYSICSDFKNNDSRIKLIKQTNKGAAAARNLGISLATGNYILPVDADNLISRRYIELALDVLLTNPGIKVVSCEAIFFEKKSGRWIFPQFDLKILAYKNIIDNCAMYRKEDWVKCGGYCETILGPEDWDFWISVLKNGGGFYRLSHVGLFYRKRGNSKTAATRKLKADLLKQLNERHKSFMYKNLGGKLRWIRHWSAFINSIVNVFFKEHFCIKEKYIVFEDFVYGINENLIDYKKVQNYYRAEYNQNIFRIYSDKNAVANFDESDNNLHFVGIYRKSFLFYTLKCYSIFLESNNEKINL